MIKWYATTTSLDYGSCQYKFEFETFEDIKLTKFLMVLETIDDLYFDNFFMEKQDAFTTSKPPSNEIIPNIEQGKYNGRIDHDECILIEVRVPQITFLLK